MAQIRQLVYELEWWEFYDLCEELLRITGAPDEVAEELDTIFVQQGLPYSISSTGIAWRLSAPASAVFVQTKELLQHPNLMGPSQQWDKALEHLSKRPPDAENCIKDAVGALEGLARILSAKPSDTLGQIIKPLGTQLGVHPALTSAVSSVYGYRGDEQAIAHGATSALQDLVAEAEMVLHWCAAAMLFLAKKSGRF
ncbi:MAG: hypothetical protein HY669_03940 [Chloroflexi bacterium]|nr:hypothetical protein [Chloroflexota bacterium]